MPELTKINPILLKISLKAYFKEQLLRSCPRGRDKCKDLVVKSTKTANEELEKCAACMIKVLLDESKL